MLFDAFSMLRWTIKFPVKWTVKLWTDFRVISTCWCSSTFKLGYKIVQVWWLCYKGPLIAGLQLTSRRTWFYWESISLRRELDPSLVTQGSEWEFVGSKIFLQQRSSGDWGWISWSARLNRRSVPHALCHMPNAWS